MANEKKSGPIRVVLADDHSIVREGLRLILSSDAALQVIGQAADGHEALEAVRKLKPIAQEAGLTMSQFALAWILREPNVASAIVGASRPDQLDENAAASGASVDPALFARAEAIVAGVAPA